MSSIFNKPLQTQSDVRSYLRFSLDKESYALPLLSVKEVIAMPEVTQIPNTPKHFLGIMNLRGQIISIIDLRTKLNIKNDFNSETTVIICEMQPYCIGIVVNSVDSVLSISTQDIKPKPEIEGQNNINYISGVLNINDELILLVDIAKALDVQDYASVSDVNKTKKVS